MDYDRDKVRAILESARKRTRPRVHDTLVIFDAIVTMRDHHASWRQLANLLPPGAPHWRTVHQHFHTWSEGQIPTVLDRALIAAERGDLINLA